MARVYNSNKATLDEVRVSALLACDKPEDCPPTSNAAKYHISRSFCHAARLKYPHVASHSDHLPSPLSSGGYKMEGDALVPVMMTLEPMSISIEEDVSCNLVHYCYLLYIKIRTS